VTCFTIKFGTSKKYGVNVDIERYQAMLKFSGRKLIWVCLKIVYTPKWMFSSGFDDDKAYDLTRVFPWFSDNFSYFSHRWIFEATPSFHSLAHVNGHVQAESLGWLTWWMSVGRSCLRINEAAGHGSKSASVVVCIPLNKWGDSQYHGQFYSDLMEKTRWWSLEL